MLPNPSSQALDLHRPANIERHETRFKNPAQMEQRNGRIDRTLQPASEVRCHYFFCPARKEDAVLRKLVQYGRDDSVRARLPRNGGDESPR
ncbi:MAG: hypothetical protein IPK13_11750 [Deltaproteobacteria bacterium]|nr:hypothetical protein [Deltaproteobacteria bacterium]